MAAEAGAPDLILIKNLAGGDQYGGPEVTELCVDRNTRKPVVRKSFGLWGQFHDSDNETPWPHKDVFVHRNLPKHPNLVSTISEHLRWPNRTQVTYLLEPYANCGNLGALLELLKELGHPLPEPFGWHIIIQALQALNALWRAGLHHGDFHLHNLFLNYAADQDTFPDVVVGDFGEQYLSSLNQGQYLDVVNFLKRFGDLALRGQETKYSKDLLTWVEHLENLYTAEHWRDFTPEVMARFYLQAYKHIDRSAPQALRPGYLQLFRGLRAALNNELAEGLPRDFGPVSIYSKQSAPEPFTNVEEEMTEVLRQCEVLLKPQDDEQFRRMFDSSLSNQGDPLITAHKLAWFSRRAQQMAKGEVDRFAQRGVAQRPDNFRECIQMCDIVSLCGRLSSQNRERHLAHEQLEMQNAMASAMTSLEAINRSLLNWPQDKQE